MTSRVKLTADSLAAAAKEFLELAVQYERYTANEEADDFDANTYEGLADLASTEALLGKIVTLLDHHRAKRDRTINTARVVHLVTALLEKFPDPKQLPEDSVGLVTKIAAPHGLDLSNREARKLIDAARKPGNNHLQTMYRSVAMKPLDQRTLSDIRTLIKPTKSSDPRKEKVGKGTFKKANQLDIAWYESAGATESLRYVLKLLNAPKAAEEALTAWVRELLRQLHGHAGEEPANTSSPIADSDTISEVDE